MGSAVLALALACSPAISQTKKGKAAPAAAAPAPQKQDEEYTKLIKEYLQDPRISTELVDHMPASDTVPSPLKFLGRIPGKPGELTYAHDIERYYEALAQASPRARFWKMGTTEEGRDIVVLAIADEATIKDLDKYKDMLAQLGDPRKITDEQAKELFHTAKPIYWINSGIHSPETGGPEMLIELAYRLIVEETPFIQQIRNNVITFITPVLEVDGRERVVDAYYYCKKHPGVGRNNLMMYWGKYVQHDDNRDGMGQYLQMTKAFTKGVLDWHPTVLHDLHEAQSYLYVSTGTGPYNVSLDPHRRSTNGGGWRKPKSWRWPSAACPACGPTATTTAGCPIIFSGSLSRTTPSGASTRCRATAPTCRRTCNWAAPPPAVNGSGPIRRCPPSSGDRATTPTSRNRPFSSR